VGLPGRIAPAPPGLHGFDTSAVLDGGHCQVAKALGFSFCIRYVSRDERESLGDLSEAEARTILNAGLALMPVQHVAREGWSPTKLLGAAYGKNAAAHVLQIGFPPGVSVWLDLEGIKISTSHRAVIDYCNAWIAEITSAGFVRVCMSVPKRFLRAKRFFGEFKPNTFGDPEARFRTSRIGATS
jgi:hypothetical protein